MDTDDGCFVIEGDHGSPEDAAFDEVVGVIEDFMINFDLDGALRTLPPSHNVANDHERHTLFKNFVSNVERELDKHVMNQCPQFADVAQVGQLLESRKDEIDDGVWEFISEGCLDYVYLSARWASVHP
ncbi:hypothetical protein STCU_03698 [Strigomonas culicis]|uniref:ARF-like 2-binding protein n=1 Tax=Strigomonas culicis TaxID=28005 RepID=S9W542_9TRYP|nr:hypothetical protein STCU_03698 [Strigomonas culicis]|eukprot:EPY31005.1 hypothetical protein STCU_03698 [Strigomonas culicis]